MISVAATDRNDKLASFSNYGRNTVDIAAPGVSIYSTLPGGRYGSYSGTSMAAPHVTGAIALVWDAHPTWTYQQVLEAVLNTTDSVASLSGKVAHGRLNVAKAIAYGSTTPTPTPTPRRSVRRRRSRRPTSANRYLDFIPVNSTLAIAKDISISDLNVTVNVSHSYVGDLRVTLIAPDGTRVVLFNRRGGNGDNLTNAVFDDEGDDSIYAGSTPFAGSFKPEYVLSAFDGKSAKGTWTLEIVDTTSSIRAN